MARQVPCINCSKELNELLDKLKGLHEVTVGPRKRLYINKQSSTDKRTRLNPQCSQDVLEISEVSSDKLHLEHDDVNSGDHNSFVRISQPGKI